MRILALGLVSLLIGCANMMMKPMSEKELKTSKVLKHSMSADKAYEKTLIFLTKKLSNSNFSIKMKDKDLGKIILKFSHSCEWLKRPDIVVKVQSTDIFYTGEISFKDKKTKYDVKMESFYRGELGDSQGRFWIAQDKGQKEAVQKCNNKLIYMIHNGSHKKVDNENW